MEDLRNRILKEAHGFCYSIYMVSTKMYHDLGEAYSWDGLKRDIEEFVAKCPNVQHVKVEHLILGRLSQIMDVPTWKWEAINRDLFVGLPQTQRQNDFVWVVVDRLTKYAHFILVKCNYSAKDYARIDINEIMGLHGIPLSIILDRGAQFTSHVLKAFEKGLTTQVKLSIAFILRRMAKRNVPFRHLKKC